MSHVTCHASPVFIRKTMRFVQGAILLGVGFLALGSGLAQTISSTELINRAKDYDGQTVVYRGEVIGEVMARGEYAWVNINDGKNALGIWVKKDLAGLIANTGSYKTIGDLVEVAGEFHRSCLDHGGDLDIHAQSLSLIKSGYRVAEKLGARKSKVAYSLGTILIILWIYSILVKPRKQR